MKSKKKDFNIFLTNSPEETILLGKKIAKKLKQGDKLYLIGDYGSGKTTFVKGVAMGLGIKQNVRSVSFLIQKKYVSSKTNLYHLDFYRLSPEESRDFYINCCLPIKNGIQVIEWADKLGEIINKDGIKITFKHVTTNKREIKIYYQS